MNKELCENLATAVDYFQCGERFKELLNEQDEKVQTLEKRFRADKNRGEGKFMFLFVLAVIGMVSSGLIILATAIMLFSGDQFGEGDFIILSTLPFMLLFSVGLFAFVKIHEKTKERKFKKIYQNEIQPQIDQAKEEVNNIKIAVQEFAQKNLHLIEFLPMQYRHLQAVSFMFYAVKNGRADTLKEAINLYEEQLHRWKVENAAQEALETQQYMAYAMDELNARQVETNKRLLAIQAMQYWNYINEKNN